MIYSPHRRSFELTAQRTLQKMSCEPQGSACTRSETYLPYVVAGARKPWYSIQTSRLGSACTDKGELQTVRLSDNPLDLSVFARWCPYPPLNIYYLPYRAWVWTITYLSSAYRPKSSPLWMGSASPFVFLIQSAGVREQTAPREYIIDFHIVEVDHEDKVARLEPFNGFQYNFRLILIIRS